MKSMSKLVEQSGHLVPCKQRRLAFRSFGIIAHIKYYRHLVPLAALLLEAVHPSSTTLCRTTEIVTIEESFTLAILIDYLEGFHVRMIQGDVSTLLEGKTVDTTCCIEHSIDKHTVYIEVRLYLIV